MRAYLIPHHQKCRYTLYSFVIHSMFSHSEHEGEPEVNDNTSSTNDQCDAHDEELVNGMLILDRIFN